MDLKYQAPFSFPTDFKPTMLNEDSEQSKFKGTAFDPDYKSKIGKNEPKFRNHDSKKVSTGTIYTRKSETFDKDDVPTGDGIKPEEKRGRGRPPGKYGSYKKRIKEALELHSVLESEQLDELSKKTLANYIRKSAFNARDSALSAGYASARSSQDALNGYNYSSGEQAKKSLQNANKSTKRVFGIVKATNRLTKENYDLLEGLNDDDYYIIHPKNKQIVSNIGKVRVPLFSQPEDDKYVQNRIQDANKRKGDGHSVMKGSFLKYEKGYKFIHEGSQVQIGNKTGVVQHIIGSDVFVNIKEGLKRFHIDNVNLMLETLEDDTLIEGVSWDRWDRSHKGAQGMSKNNVGSWMVSKHADGYKYGHKEGVDHITVHGTGKDAAKKAKEWANKNGYKNVYMLETFTPEKDKSELSFTNIVKSAFSV